MNIKIIKQKTEIEIEKKNEKKRIYNIFSLK